MSEPFLTLTPVLLIFITFVWKTVMSLEIMLFMQMGYLLKLVAKDTLINVFIKNINFNLKNYNCFKLKRMKVLSFDVGMVPLAKGIWIDFVQKLRHLYDAMHEIPNLAFSPENHEDGKHHHHSILHQKLCMLNYCLYRKKAARTNRSKTSTNKY
jgi:hypothetical protein